MNLEDLPEELLGLILDKLSIETLIDIMRTNQLIRTRFYYLYEPLITQEREDYLYPQEAITAIMTNIEDEMIRKQSLESLCWVSPDLAQAMGLGYQRIIYPRLLVFLWWNVYLRDNKLLDSRSRVYPDDFVNSVFGTYYHYLTNFHITGLYNLIDDHFLQCDPNLSVTPQEYIALYREWKELKFYLDRLILTKL